MERTMQTPMKLLDALSGAEYVQVDGEIFETEYLRMPDEHTVADDILLEAKSGETELYFTQGDFNDAQYIGEGIYRLKSGIQLRFLSSTTIH